MKPAPKIIFVCLIANILMLVHSASSCLSATPMGTNNINGNNNIIASGDVTIIQGATNKQNAEFRKIILQQDWEATKDNPAFRKLVRACNGGKNVEQLGSYSKAIFWEDLSTFLDKVEQADANVQKLLQQGSISQELQELIPKIEVARNDFNYDEVNRLLQGFRDKHKDLQKDFAKTYFIQGENYQLQINFVEAERYYKKAAAIEDENPMYLFAHGRILWLLNRYSEAEPLLRRVLAISEKTLGKEHADIAIYLNNLANLLNDDDKSVEAEPLSRRALAIDEKVYGKEHPMVANDMYILADILYNQDKFAEVETLYRRAVAICEKTMDKDPFEVNTSLGNLAVFLSDQGKYAEAELFLRRSLAIMEKKFGKEHLLVAESLFSLAITLEKQGKYAEAETLYRQVLAISEKQYGKENFIVAQRLNDLAGLLHDQGKYDDAEPLYRRALAISEKSRGKEDLITVSIRKKLNDVLDKKK